MYGCERPELKFCSINSKKSYPAIKQKKNLKLTVINKEKRSVLFLEHVSNKQIEQRRNHKQVRIFLKLVKLI